jgi:hypothetical protein
MRINVGAAIWRWHNPNTKVKDFGMLDLHLQKLMKVDVKA